MGVDTIRKIMTNPPTNNINKRIIIHSARQTLVKILRSKTKRRLPVSIYISNKASLMTEVTSSSSKQQALFEFNHEQK